MNPNNKKNNKGLFLYLATAAVIILSLILMWSLFQDASKEQDYSEIIKYFDDYKVSEYTLDLGTGELVMTVEGEEKPITYKVPKVDIFLNDIQSETRNYRAEYNALHPDAPLKQTYYPIKHNWFVEMLPYIIPLAVIIVLFLIMMKQTGGGKMSQFGKANYKSQSQFGKKTTFADVAGAEEEKEEVAEIVDFLKNPKKYHDIGARVPKGVLLMGPPGTGKTLLARAIAGEAGVPFFSISGSDFIEMYVGVGASRVRDLFDTAKKNAPSIIFIDEIDAVGRQRGAGLGGGQDEREQTLNQLLVEMDGFAANENVIVLAGTNRRDVLDPALTRPGRFDRQILVGLPDVKGREEILKIHTRNKPLAPDVDLSVIAKTTAGFTGADLENLVNEAALLAARANRKAVTMKDISEASIKVIAGPEKKSHVVTDEEKRLTAYHESGHALCFHYLPTQDRVQHVTIMPRGGAGGFTMPLPEKDHSFITKTWMKENITTLLGGRVAEKLVLDDISTGASNDIERATRLARAMVTKYGFSEKLGPIVYGQDQEEVFLGRDFSSSPRYSENVAAEIDAEVREIIEDSYEKAMDLLKEHDDDLHRLANYLLEYEQIDGADFEKFMRGELTSAQEEAAKGKVLDVTAGGDSVEETKTEDILPEETSEE